MISALSLAVCCSVKAKSVCEASLNKLLKRINTRVALTGWLAEVLGMNFKLSGGIICRLAERYASW